MRYIVIFCSILLIFLMVRFAAYYHDKPVYQDGDQFEIVYTLLDEPKTTSYSQRIRIDNLTVYIPRFPEYHYGDSLKISGVVEKKPLPDGKGSRLVVENAKTEALSDTNSLLLGPIASIRRHITTTFNRYLFREEAGLLLGIVFGIKSNLDPELYEMLRQTGVLHVIAASGMNVSLVGSFFLLLFSQIFPRRRAILMTVGMIILYAILSGLDPSILRATIMAGVVFFAQIIGRQNLSFLNLFVTAILMLFVSPDLLFDVGFQLSFASTIGILIFNPLLSSIQFIKTLTEKIFLFEDFPTSLSAQLTTLPIFFYAFSSYSLISIIVNIFVLWTVPFLMVLGGVAALVSFIHPIFAVPLLYLALPLLMVFKGCVKFFSHFSQELTINEFPMVWVCGYYLILLALVIWAHKRQKEEKPFSNDSLTRSKKI